MKLEVALAGSPKDPPTPLTILHKPVPTVGVFPASVALVNPQVAAFVWSAPAGAGGGAADTTPPTDKFLVVAPVVTIEIPPLNEPTVAVLDNFTNTLVEATEPLVGIKVTEDA